MLQINISTQPTRLEYINRNAQLNLQSTRPVMQIETTPATVEISQPRGELTIDMTQYRYSIGLKNNTDFTRDNAEIGKQAVLGTIAKTVEEGDRLAKIENKSNAIAEIAANSTVSEIPDITLAPIAAPEIHYQANQVQFNPIAGKINLTVQPGSVQGDYQPGSIEIRVLQYPSIEMSVVDVQV